MHYKELHTHKYDTSTAISFLTGSLHADKSAHIHIAKLAMTKLSQQKAKCCLYAYAVYVVLAADSLKKLCKSEILNILQTSFACNTPFLHYLNYYYCYQIMCTVI